MNVTETKKGRVTIIAIEGRLDSATTPEVEAKLSEVMNAENKAVVLDFSGLEYISSAGIRLLVHCHKTFEKSSGKIVLAAVPKPIENVLYITGFLPYFKVFDTQAAAVEALTKE